MFNLPLKLIKLSLALYFSFFFVNATVNLISEDWEIGTLDNWNSWGSPLPYLNSSSNALGEFSIDPNGDGSYHSGLVSKQLFTLSENTRLTLDAYITSALFWSELEFGLVDTNVIPNNPITSQYNIVSIVIDADTQNTGHKLYSNFEGIGGSQTIFRNDISSDYFNSWNNFIFDFNDNGSVSISINDDLVFNSDPGIFDYANEPSFAIMLAGRSYGAADNLYDNLLLQQVPESSSFSVIVGTIAMLLAFLIRDKDKY